MRLQPCCFGLIQKRSEVTDDAMHQNPSHLGLRGRTERRRVVEGRVDL